MTARLRILGDERALELAGLAAPAQGAPGGPDGPTVHLGPTTEPADVIWLSTPHPGEGRTPDGGVTGPARVIATGGRGLWGRAPWPARDELFELPPPPAARALVVSADPERRGQVLEKLAARGLPAAGATALSAADLAAASVVALLGDAGAATPEAPAAAAAMPGEAPAVLAARRVLLAPRCQTTFGLLPGTDHLAFGTDDDVVQYADAVLTHPESFAPLQALGARTAERHRASLVYACLADELE
jgi:hypothetical protein